MFLRKLRIHTLTIVKIMLHSWRTCCKLRQLEGTGLWGLPVRCLDGHGGSMRLPAKNGWGMLRPRRKGNFRQRNLNLCMQPPTVGRKQSCHSFPIIYNSSNQLNMYHLHPFSLLEVVGFLHHLVNGSVARTPFMNVFPRGFPVYIPYRDLATVSAESANGVGGIGKRRGLWMDMPDCCKSNGGFSVSAKWAFATSHSRDIVIR